MNGRYIRGFCLPDYAGKAEEDNDMDQTKFNQMFREAMTAYRKELQDNDCGDYSEAARKWATETGLIGRERARPSTGCPTTCGRT